MYTTIDQVKRHLNIDPDFNDDNLLLLQYINAAEDAVAKYLDKDLADLVDCEGTIPASIRSAIWLMVGHLYNNREAVGYSSATKVPLAYEYLLDQYASTAKTF